MLGLSEYTCVPEICILSLAFCTAYFKITPLTTINHRVQVHTLFVSLSLSLSLSHTHTNTYSIH